MKHKRLTYIKVNPINTIKPLKSNEQSIYQVNQSIMVPHIGNNPINMKNEILDKRKYCKKLKCCHI